MTVTPARDSNRVCVARGGGGGGVLARRCIAIYLLFAGPKGHRGAAKALSDLGCVLWESCAYPDFAGETETRALELIRTRCPLPGQKKKTEDKTVTRTTYNEKEREFDE